MSQIRVIPLGAGQDVGRSCVVVSIGGRNIMFDCGMHMGYNDERRFPNFKYISGGENYTELIDAVIISHFHLDHCGAIPYFTEMCGYRGPVYMTYPTKAICPILLEDFRKISVDKKGETNFFTTQNIRDCMKRVIAVNLFQTVKCGDDIEITAYYAGHVLGAAMFHVKVGSESVLYTGDYNTTPDRHLGAAQVEKLRVDLLITETTYATTIRDSKRLRERDFLKRVHETVARGGKVLIPVFALGRAQELCILIETYWERMGINVPVYFSAGLVERANLYYKLFINWTNQKIKNSFVENNIFDFKHIKAFDRALIDAPGPMVLFATPGMLHAGMSLEVFKKWCEGEKNTCILPGYCVNGTVGAKILAGERRVDLDKRTRLEVNCQVASLSFSAHADAKGIMQLISQCEPKNVMLCHGERNKMQFLKQRIMDEFGIPCYDPANGETLVIQNYPPVPVEISKKLLKLELSRPSSSTMARVDGSRDISGVLVRRPDGPVRLLHASEAEQELGIKRHELSFSASIALHGRNSPLDIWKVVAQALPATAVAQLEMQNLHSLQYRSIQLNIKGADSNSSPTLMVRWLLEDDDVADGIVRAVQACFPKIESDTKKLKT